MKLTSFLIAIAFTTGVVCNVLAQNTSPLPAGDTEIGNHLHAGQNNEVWSDASILYFNYRGSAATTHFWNLGNSTGKSIMTLLNGGNVGIGTMSPSFSLDVQGFGSRIKNTSNSFNTYTSFRVQGQDYVNGLEIDFFGNNNISSDPAYSYGGGPGSAAIVNVNAKPLVLGTNNQSKMVIDGAGNVGIGITSPSDILHINSANPAIYLTSTASSPWAALRGNGGTWILGYGGNAGSEDISMGSQDGSGSSRTLTFATGGSARMKILANGNVGIGTSSPDAKLAVSGQVHAQEVKVSVTVPGPDYVFEKDYQLTSLEEIKNYIDQNKHLPEVPSAKEMEKNGVQLGEMNMLLLKKIEELTLYVIELKNRDEAQQKEIELLKSKK